MMNPLAHMAPVLSSASMREADRVTIEELGIPAHTLMESAGREAAEVAEEMIEVILDVRRERSEWVDERVQHPTAHIVCLCGKGNNGGDGLVIARYLAGRGHRVSVVLFGDKYSGAAATNLAILKKVADHHSVVVVPYINESTLDELGPVDLVVDAILGTGLQANVKPPVLEVIGWVNRQPGAILSVDIPTGLNADSGHVLGNAIKAHVTVTMGALKPGLLIEDGPDIVGALQVVDIGIPPFVLESSLLGEAEIRVSDAVFVSSCLPTRSRKDHKYTYGPTIVAGGSKAFPGAPVLASLGAAKIGSGYVFCLCPDDIKSLLEEKLTEIPVESWSDGGDVALASMLERLGTRWTKTKGFLIGPGLGRDAKTTGLVKSLLKAHSGPAVVDADALYALRNEQVWVKAASNGQWIFTPHEGEFAMLMGSETLGINRITAARLLAKEWNVVVLLKGLPSIVASPEGRVVINSTGNPSVGTAGTGDVLSGMVAGLVSMGLSPFFAAVCGIHIAGTAADLYVEEHAAGSMMASDIVEWLPRALASYR
ncbi:MAG: NAD(P)H-hydrate dehydratase [Bacteroidetes bacterium]|nr:NAD(P)H-hydrate dehydratase [Bacteroidota bacterium]